MILRLYFVFVFGMIASDSFGFQTVPTVVSTSSSSQSSSSFINDATNVATTVDTTVTDTSTTNNAASVNKASSRQPWDILRFVRQSSKFVDFLPGSRSSRRNRPTDPIVPGTVLWEANNPTNEHIFTFGPLDDVVMGGASASTFDPSSGKWTGIVTDANNGGFVGIRSTPTVDYDLSSCQGITLKVRVGKITPSSSNKLRLKVVTRDSTEFNGVGWSSSHDVATTSSSSSKSTTTTIRIRFEDQIPTRFARTVPQSTPFNKSTVKSFQLVYSKFEYDGKLNPNFQLGPFDIQLLEIGTY